MARRAVSAASVSSSKAASRASDSRIRAAILLGRKGQVHELLAALCPAGDEALTRYRSEPLSSVVMGSAVTCLALGPPVRTRAMPSQSAEPMINPLMMAETYR